MSDEKYIDSIGTSITPLTLKTLRPLGKDDLIQILLLREITFRKVSEEFLEAIKKSKIDEFQLQRLQLSLTKDAQDMLEILEKERLMWKRRSEHHIAINSNLRSEIIRLKNEIKMLQKNI